MTYFSVIIPLYNKENFVEATIQSALNQTFIDFEIIVINDGSTDKSAEKVSQITDSRIQLLTTENQGVSATRNLGIEKASGKMIAFLDADDYWFPNHLQNLFELGEMFPEQKVFANAIQVQTGKKIFNATYSIPVTPKIQLLNFFNASLDQAVLFTSATAVDRRFLKQLGGFDETLKTDEDTDLWIRIGLESLVVFNQNIGVKYNFDSKGLSKNTSFFVQKTDFSKYQNLEKTNPALAQFLSIHRFSIALKSKISGNKEQYIRFNNLISKDLLSKKQRLLLNLPPTLLRFIFSTKIFLERFSIRLSAFKR